MICYEVPPPAAPESLPARNSRARRDESQLPVEGKGLPYEPATHGRADSRGARGPDQAPPAAGGPPCEARSLPPGAEGAPCGGARGRALAVRDLPRGGGLGRRAGGAA